MNSEQADNQRGDAAEQVREELRKQISQYPVLLYMKGSPTTPQCGFSARACGVLSAIGKPFAWVDILAEPLVRQHLPSVSEWPTFPQLFVGGELVGGSDIIAEMYESGELQEMLEQLPQGS